MWGRNESGWRENVIEWGRLEVLKNARVVTWIVLGVVGEGVAQFLGSDPEGADDLCFHTYGKLSPSPPPPSPPSPGQ